MGRALATRDALELRASGMGYTEISERLGVPRSTCYDRIQAALQALPHEAAGVVLGLELARLDRAHMRLETKAEQGTPRAIEVQLKIAARRAALLGLDTPTETKPGDLPEDPAVLKAELIRLLQEDRRAHTATDDEGATDAT